MAQTGLAFTRDPYDRERYEQLQRLAARMIAARGGGEQERIAGLLAREQGYATPKIDVRAAVFDAAGRILMVRERVDDDRWTLPGGWADPGETAAECAAKEAVQESGYQVRVVKLAACWDRQRQGHPATLFACLKLFWLCALAGGAPTTGLETSEVGWFAEHALPGDLSLGRVLPGQIRRMFAHWREPSLPTDWE